MVERKTLSGLCGDKTQAAGPTARDLQEVRIQARPTPGLLGGTVARAFHRAVGVAYAAVPCGPVLW